MNPPTTTSTTCVHLTLPKQSLFKTKLEKVWKHAQQLAEEPTSLAGFSPLVSTPFETPPSIITLKRPKVMESSNFFYRATQTHCMSSFPFNIASVQCTKRTVGVSHWDTNTWMSLDASGAPRDQRSLVAAMSAKSDPVKAEVPSKDGSPPHYREFYELLIHACLADGTSLTLRIPDFVPWTVWHFPKDLDYDGAKTYKAVHELRQAAKLSPALSCASFVVSYKEPSDGSTPDKTNPYKIATHPYIYVYNDDASFASSKAVEDLMQNARAIKSEDVGLSNELRLHQMTGLCIQTWYVANNWSEVESFTHTTQVELSIPHKNITPCFEGDANAIKLSPATECYCDIEATKDSKQGDNDFSNPDYEGSHVICIDVGLIRTGATEKYDPENHFARRIPRMEDPSPAFSKWFDALPRLAEQFRLPDPLAVKRSEDALKAKVVAESALDAELTLLNLGRRMHDDDNINSDSDDSEDEDVEHILPSDGVIPAVIKSISKYDAEDDTSNNPHLSDPVAAAHRIGSLVNFGDMDVDDMEMVDGIATLGEHARALKAGGDDNAAKMLEARLKNTPPVFDILPTSPSSGNSTDDQQDETFNSTRESPDSINTRHGYEIPSWAIRDLGALRNIAADNEREPDIKRHVLTPMVLGNLAHVRRICFFLDPKLPANAPCKRFISPGLYTDASEGIVVHAFRTEYQLLLAFRDFMVAVHPDLMCGHFFRTYDWKTLFARANKVTGDNIPMVNRAQENPLSDSSKMYHCLPVIESGFASTKDPAGNVWDIARTIWPHKSPFPLSDAVRACGGFSPTNRAPPALDRRKTVARTWQLKTERKSCFAFMDRAVFAPVTLTRKIVSSNNTGTTESIFPTLHGIDDVDSLIAIRLAYANLASYSLKSTSAKFLKDAKMDIGIARMDQAWAQRQFWPTIAYCDWDVILCAALMNVLGLRMGHASTARFSYISIGDVVNFGQQKRIFSKNAVVCHNSNMVLLKSNVLCPAAFSGGAVVTPVGGIYAANTNTLDYVSYYVTLMMEFNLCFTAFIRWWCNKFDAIDMMKMQTKPKELLVEYRQFVGRLRKVYGAPDARIRPGANKCITCRTCKTTDFSMLPLSIFCGIVSAATGMVISPERVVELLRGIQASGPTVSAETKQIMNEISRRRQSLPSHSDILEEKWPPAENGASGVKTLPLPPWMTMEDAESIRVLTSDTCPTCTSKPWFSKMDPTIDQAKIPDVSVASDPFREQRYAADADYLIPRSSAATLQSDPEAHLMRGLRRQKPVTPADGSVVYSREDLLTEHEEFDWITPSDWADKRLAVCLPEYNAEWQRKKSKHKTDREVSENQLAKQKGLKTSSAPPPYVPSIASFVLWRPGDFNNQSVADLKARFLGGSVELTEQEQALLAKKDDPALEAMNLYMETHKIKEWTVDTFAAYVKITARNANVRMWTAIAERTAFNRADYDFGFRRGIERYGNNTGNVTNLFYARKQVRAQAAVIFKENFVKGVGWKSSVAKQRWDGLDKVQNAIKANANSHFGAAGTRTGAIKNTFVAAAITFFSRNYIAFTTYVSVTRWTPPKEMWPQIIKYRRESLMGAAEFKGISKLFFKRYLLDAAFPMAHHGAAQTWLPPISTATDMMDMSRTESMIGIATIYGDTDSIMSMSPGVVLGDPKHATHEMDVARRQLGMDTGKGCSGLVTNHYVALGMRFVRLEWEKMFWPFAAPHRLKKKYIGRYWAEPVDYKEDTVKSWLIKRDIPAFQQKLKTPLVTEFMTSMSVDRVNEVFTSTFERLIASKGVIQDVERDVIPYARSQAFKKTNYANPAAHYEANKRLAEDYPGNEHALGERVDWVVCAIVGSPDQAISSRSFTVRHLQLMVEDKSPKAAQKLSKLRIDTSYYIRSTATVIRDVYRITRCPTPIYAEPSVLASPQSSLARHFAEVVARTGKPPAILPPKSPLSLVCFSAGLVLDDDSGAMTPMTDEEIQQKRPWFESEVLAHASKIWGTSLFAAGASLPAESTTPARRSASTLDMMTPGGISSRAVQMSDKDLARYFSKMADAFVEKYAVSASKSLVARDAIHNFFANNMKRSGGPTSGRPASNPEMLSLAPPAKRKMTLDR